MLIIGPSTHSGDSTGQQEISGYGAAQYPPRWAALIGPLDALAVVIPQRQPAQ